MRNTHWPEPITIEEHADFLWGFNIQEIVNTVEEADGDAFDRFLEEHKREDEEGYTIYDRTAYRLERCYNACAGLNIQGDTKLKEVLIEMLNALGKTPAIYLENSPLFHEIEALLSEQIVQGE